MRGFLLVFVLTMAAGCTLPRTTHECPHRLFLLPQPDQDGTAFVVRDTNGTSYLLSELRFNVTGEGVPNIEGTFPDAKEGRVEGVSYHDARSPPTELNLGDSLRVASRNHSYIDVYRGDRAVGGTWYCI